MDRYVVWTGPTQVSGTANSLRAVGLHVTCEGTEHVYFEAHNLTQVLNADLPSWLKRTVRLVY